MINKSKKIVFASHTFMGGPFVVGSHHLAMEFAKRGFQVLHISTPITPMHLIKIRDKWVRERFNISLIDKNKCYKKNIINYVPFSLCPWLERFSTINTMLATGLPSFKKTISKMGFNDADLLLIDQPKFVNIEKYINPKKIVYRPTDVYSQMEKNTWIDDVEKKILSVSDSVIATSKPVLDHIKSLNPMIKGTIVENGVDVERFRKKYKKPIEYVKIHNKIAVYVGALDDRIDLIAFKKLALNHTNLEIVIIGPFNRIVQEQLSGLQNLTLLGERKYEEIPSYLQYADIGLLPLNDNPANEGRSPMKLYEYAASGLPVVSKSTLELRRRNELFIHLYTNYSEMNECITEILCNDNSHFNNVSTVDEQSWSAKVDTILDFIYE